MLLCRSLRAVRVVRARVGRGIWGRYPHLEGAESGDAARDRNDERRPGGHRGRAGTKTARFLQLVTERHGPFGGIPLDQVSPISSELAAGVELDPGAARAALRARVRAAARARYDEDSAEGDAG